MRAIDRLIRRGGDTYWEGEASGAAVLMTTYGSPDREAILPGLAGATRQAYSGNAIVFGAILARLMLFAEADFKFQALHADRRLFGTPALGPLEYPWPNGTTGELLARMEQDASLAGNAYIWNAGEQLVRLRPDWVTIVSELTLDATGRRTYRRVLGYAFDPPVTSQSEWGPPQFYSVDETAHWSPIPDPNAQFRGMSWLAPVIREINADNAMTAYKGQYLENAATPNLLIKYDQELKPETVDSIRERVQARYAGVGNAFKTMVLDRGADATVIGNTFEQMNFTSVQAAGENRILIAAGVPGIVVGSKEGLMAATYSNFDQAMRRFADITMRPLWRSACACLSSLVTVPPGARLWFDTSGIAALRQGEKERAETLLVKAQAASELVKAGYEPSSVVTALESGDMSQLTFTPVPDATPLDFRPGPPTVVPTAKPVPALAGG
ncbi:phage portal protein [Frankia sp. Cj3]|uniref:phage portal protein n=1 Tax=Frankia sp. Cj3 TaxID=2880976 RepID=UPI001EF5FD68|nr:phage portal protein [Frankia sp. Cj3]